MIQMAYRLGKTPGPEYVDFIEICSYMELRQGIRRQLIVEALLSAALSLCGETKAFSEATETVRARYGVE